MTPTIIPILIERQKVAAEFITTARRVRLAYGDPTSVAQCTLEGVRRATVLLGHTVQTPARRTVS